MAGVSPDKLETIMTKKTSTNIHKYGDERLHPAASRVSEPGGPSGTATRCRGNKWMNGKGFAGKPDFHLQTDQLVFCCKMNHKEPNFQNKVARKIGSSAFL